MGFSHSKPTIWGSKMYGNPHVCISHYNPAHRRWRMLEPPSGKSAVEITLLATTPPKLPESSRNLMGLGHQRETSWKALKEQGRKPHTNTTLSISLSIYLSIYLPTYLLIYAHTSHKFVYASIHICIIQLYYTHTCTSLKKS